MTMVVPLAHCGLGKYEAGLHSKQKNNVVTICVCMQRDVCKGWFGMNKIICESTLHKLGHARYVEGVL